MIEPFRVEEIAELVEFDVRCFITNKLRWKPEALTQLELYAVRKGVPPDKLTDPQFLKVRWDKHVQLWIFHWQGKFYRPKIVEVRA